VQLNQFELLVEPEQEVQQSAGWGRGKLTKVRNN